MAKITRKRPALKAKKTKTVIAKASKAKASKAKASKAKASKAKSVPKPAPVKVNKRIAKTQKKEEEKIEQRNLVMTNGAPVDHLVLDMSQHEVVMHNKTVLNCNLMFADCGQNVNQFYIIQGLK
jgi:hypothetical protein